MPKDDAPTLTQRRLNRATLARQMLLAREKREKTTALRVIERLAGMQAQWPQPPYIGLWTRIDGFERADLARLFTRRDAVRATMMRGTIHVVSAKDYAAWRPMLQPLLTRGMRSILRGVADEIDLDGLVAEARAFFDEEPRTFTELRAHLVKRKHQPKIPERAMGLAVRYHLPLAMVPTDAARGFPSNADFAVAEKWLGKPVGKSDAPDALVLRYLAAFGPATVGDVQEWSGLAGLREVVERLRPKLVTFRDERKRELFDLPKAPRPDTDVDTPVRFLPEFDNLILAHSDRSRFIAEQHRAFVFLPGLRVLQTILVDGFVAGTWTIERVKRSATLVVEPFGALSKKVEREVAAEGDALLRFHDADAESFDVRFAKPKQR